MNHTFWKAPFATVASTIADASSTTEKSATITSNNHSAKNIAVDLTTPADNTSSILTSKPSSNNLLCNTGGGYNNKDQEQQSLLQRFYYSCGYNPSFTAALLLATTSSTTSSSEEGSLSDNFTNSKDNKADISEESLILRRNSSDIFDNLSDDCSTDDTLDNNTLTKDNLQLLSSLEAVEVLESNNQLELASDLGGENSWTSIIGEDFFASATSAPLQTISIYTGFIRNGRRRKGTYSYLNCFSFDTSNAILDDRVCPDNRSYRDIEAMEWNEALSSTSTEISGSSSSSNSSCYMSDDAQTNYTSYYSNRVEDNNLEAPGLTHSQSQSILMPLARAWQAKREQWRTPMYPDSSTTNDESTITSRSIAMSDATPVISNRDNHTKLPYSRPPSSLSASVPPVVDENEHYSTTSSSGEAVVSPNNERVNEENNRTCCKSKAMYLIIALIFLLAIATIATSAVLSQRNKSNKGEASQIDSSNTEGSIGSNGNTAANKFPTAAPTKVRTRKTPAPTSKNKKTETTRNSNTIKNTTAVPTINETNDDVPHVQVAVNKGFDDDNIMTAQSNTKTRRPTKSPTSAPTTSTLSWSSTKFNMTQELQGRLEGSNFGASVALSRDGRVLVIAAPADSVPNGAARAGRVYVYIKSDNSQEWKLQQTLEGRNEQDNFGSAVAISEDGSIIAVSEPNANSRTGNVRVFRFSGLSYTLLGEEISGEDSGSYFGVSIALSGNGERLVVGIPYATGVNNLKIHGQVRVYDFIGSNWTLIGDPLSGSGNLDWLGSAVDISKDGSIIAASAPRNLKEAGYVRIWNWNGTTGNWGQLGSGDISNTIAPAQSDNRFGDSISLSYVNSVLRIAIGIPWKDYNGIQDTGMTLVYQFQRQSDNWTLLGDPILPNFPAAGDESGSSVFLFNDTLAVGIPGAHEKSGKLQLYKFVDKEWQGLKSPLGDYDAGSDFGISVSMREKDDGSVELVAGAVTANRMGAGFAAIFEEQ